MKQVFSASATGQSSTVLVKGGAIIQVTIAGTGSARLQANLDGDWLPIRAADTATTANAVILTLPNREEPYLLRWDVTANNSTVTVYIS